MIRRFCTRCQRVTTHRIEGASINTGHHVCGVCGNRTRRYDLRPRSWAGV